MVIVEALPGKVTLNLNDEKDTYMQGPKEIVAQKEGTTVQKPGGKKSVEVNIIGIMIRNKSKMTMITLHEYIRLGYFFHQALSSGYEPTPSQGNMLVHTVHSASSPFMA